MPVFDSAPAETLESFDRGVLLAALSCIKGLSHVALYQSGEGFEILPGRSNPASRFHCAPHYSSIRLYVS